MPAVDEVIGKRLTWDEIVNMFPDRWVGVSDYEFDGGNLVSGVLQAVCTDDKIYDYAKPLRDKGIKLFWDRTTYLPGNALWID